MRKNSSTTNPSRVWLWIAGVFLLLCVFLGAEVVRLRAENALVHEVLEELVLQVDDSNLKSYEALMDLPAEQDGHRAIRLIQAMAKGLSPSDQRVCEDFVSTITSAAAANTSNLNADHKAVSAARARINLPPPGMKIDPGLVNRM